MERLMPKHWHAIRREITQTGAHTAWIETEMSQEMAQAVVDRDKGFNPGTPMEGGFGTEWEVAACGGCPRQVS